ncbi:putative aprataxin and PNK-like factor isoform X2 [Apostichopus japonicus]|uniref:Putative aprataxin and PNK-like factor isoform X2 n=1 Tax=Stichopus japonicus TaxID=307972 RepID=A0A2G8KZY1_STIJA|nr:putative aprataxin and PNK-like factor isoform X2 [Apostichopus japonicus]
MSGVELKPCGVSSGDNILVPLGSTTVGRGPFLGISDKRVSRNHAILDIEDGKFRVKPIHVNPTYFSKTGDSKLKPLKKDEWKELENGNRISLTPNEHIFEVMIDDRPVQSLTQSPRSSIGTASPVKTFKDSPLKSQTEDKEEEDAPSPACRKLDFHADNNDSTAEEETNDGQEEVKKSLSNEKDDGDEEDSTPLGEEDEMDVKPPSEDNKKYAKPVNRNRELPAWMLNLPSGQEEEPQKEQPKVAKKAKAAPKASSRAKKRPANEISDEEEEEEVKPPAKKRGAPARTPRKKTATLYKEDEEEEDEEDEAPVPELKKRTSSRGRQTTRVSYVDDVEVDDDEGDEEFVAARDDEEEEESDWEEASSPKKGKGKGKGKSPRGAKAKKRKGRRSTYSDEESSEEDVYIPKPTKRTAKILSDSQRSTDSETTNSRRRRNRSDDKENGDETRKPCPYGSKCYRKNPRHNKDFSHPDDDDYKSESEIVEPDEDDKAECPYGLNCYRTNLEHKKQFKHPLSSDRPQRQTRRGRGSRRERKHEDAPDTYDYEDSFLDDKKKKRGHSPDEDV